MKRDSTLEDWERFWDRNKHVEEIYPASESIIENLAAVTDVNGKKILEVGAGTGRDSIKLSSMGADVTVLDYSGNALYKAGEVIESTASSVHLIRGDGTCMPFEDASFDIIFHQGLMEHFRDPLPLFKENMRVLKKNGLLLVDVPQKYHIYTVIKHILIAMNKWFAGWETEYTVGELKRIFLTHDFIICHEYGDFMCPSLLFRIMREIFKKIGIELPMYPPSIPVLKNIRRSIKSMYVKLPFAMNTFLTIGVIGRKA